MAIYYESLCPDSFRFISKQLGAAYLILMDSIDVEFIPFGKSEVRQNFDGWLLCIDNIIILF